MHSSSSTFFLSKNEPSLETDTPLNKIRKMIDGQLAYNHLLAKQVLHDSGKEFIQIAGSYYLKLSDIPADIEIDVTSQTYKGLKRILVSRIINDIKIYEDIKQTATNYTDLDYLYLHLHCNLADMKSEYKLTKDELKAILSVIFNGNQLNTMTKKAQSYSTRTDSHSNIEKKMANEMISLLKPGVSCMAFVECYQVKQIGTDGASLALTDYNLTEKNHNKITMQVSPYLSSQEKDQEIHDLYQLYQSAHQELLKLFGGIKVKDGFVKHYLNIFDKFKPFFKARNDLQAKMKNLSAENRKEPVLSIQIAETNINTNNNKKKKKKIPVRSQQQTNQNNSVLPVNKVSQEPEDKAVTAIKAETETKAGTEIKAETAIKAEAEFKADTEVKAETEIKAEPEVKAETEIKAENELATELSTYTDFHLFKKPAPIIQNNQIPLNINIQTPLIQSNQLNGYDDDHHQTFLNVFDTTKKHEIGLRELVNLSTALYGTITTTGSNRCRIEIKSIYSYLLMSDEMLKNLPANQCKKATTTFHGGGHREKPSQNHDRGIAPNYLVEQFRDAFQRAGFTPQTLQHNPAAAKNNNTNSKRDV